MASPDRVNNRVKYLMTKNCQLNENLSSSY
jgi:hypothetical protein